MLLEMRNVGLGICGTLHRVGRRISPDRAVVSPAKPLNITGASSTPGRLRSIWPFRATKRSFMPQATGRGRFRW